MTDDLIITEEDVHPDGLRCCECDVELTVGMPYAMLLMALTEDAIPITEIVCVPCGMRGVVTE